MKKESKQFLILGLGRFGRSVALSLAQMGHEVLAIDESQDNVDMVSEYVTEAVVADATDEQVLRSFDPASFDAAVIAIGSETGNSILLSVLLKEMGTPYVVAKANDELHAKVLNKVGVDRVIFPERDMGKRLAQALSTDRFMEMIELSEDVDLIEMGTPSDWAGRSLLQNNVRRNFGVSVVAVRRNNELIASPSADMVLDQEDVLLIIGKKKDIARIRG